MVDGRKHTIAISVQNKTVRMWKDCLPVQSYNPNGFVFVYYNSEYPVTGNDFFQIKFDDVIMIHKQFSHQINPENLHNVFFPLRMRTGQFIKYEVLL